MPSLLTLIYILLYLFLLSFSNASLPSSYPSIYDYCPEGKERIFDLTLSKGTMAPDGFTRDMLLINGQFPGPLISAYKGDTIVLNVKNELDEDTSIHSHGMFQRGTPWYDGVPGQTECGIPAAKLLTPESQGFGPIPDSGLINGKGTFNCSSAPPGSHCVSDAPLEHSLPTFIFSIDGHELEVIEVEGMAIKPYKVNRLPINVAQRYSVIVKANKPVDSYWMRAEMQTVCFPIQNPVLNPMVKAIVTYEGSAKETPVSTAWNDKVTDCVDLDYKELVPYHEEYVPEADTTINVFVNFRRDEKNITMGYVNNSTYVADMKYPTIGKVFNGVTQFALNDNAFVIEQTQVVDVLIL
ncbi:4203_t:CDS:2, partial [Racocetra fulgida]